MIHGSGSAEALSRLLLQGLEGFFDNQSACLMQQDTSEDQPFLLVIAELPFPVRGKQWERFEKNIGKLPRAGTSWL
jgi:hypothetical protein